MLGSRGWLLNEEVLGVFAASVVFNEEAGTPRPPFDHLPVVGMLDWRA
jgi:hypothetical protein